MKKYILGLIVLLLSGCSIKYETNYYDSDGKKTTKVKNEKL